MDDHSKWDGLHLGDIEAPPVFAQHVGIVGETSSAGTEADEAEAETGEGDGEEQDRQLQNVQDFQATLALGNLGLAQSQQTFVAELSIPSTPARAQTEEVLSPSEVGSIDQDSNGEPLAETEEKLEEQKPRAAASLPFYKLFAFADKLDILLMTFGTLGAIANGLSKPLMTLVFGELTDAFGRNVNDLNKLVHEVSHVSLRYVYLGLGAGFAAFFETSLWMCAGERQATRIRAMYFKSILRQDMPFFDKEASTGEVLSRMSEDTILIQNAIGEKVGKFIQLLSTFIGGFVLAYRKGWQLSLVVSCALPLLVIAGATMAIIISKMAARGQMAYMEAGDIVQQVVSGIRTVASFTGEEKAVKDYDAALQKAYKAGVYQGLTSGLGVGCTLLILYLSYALALWYGSQLILHHDYSGGSVINVIFSILMGGMALGQASPCLGAFGTGQAAGYKMFEVIHRVPNIDISSTDGLIPATMKGDIDIRDVTFSYPARPDHCIFTDFSLTIPAGTKAALVGESGSGKSTVINLLERYYDPAQGAVLIDGIDIRQLQLKWLRERIGLVSQEPALFGVSIAENVAFGKDGVSLEEVKYACALANAAKFIERMPQAYNTHVGHQGTQLSGGQKQRLAIARAILKNPRILLLDEATSALDAESERLVQSALEQVMLGRTTVIVAHRLSTIRNADSISVVQHGRIVEQGTHANLLANPEGAYSQLIKLQAMQQDKKPEERAEEPGGPRRSVTCRRVSSLTENNVPTVVEPAVEESIRRRWSMFLCLKRGQARHASASFLRLASLNRPETPAFLLGSLAAVVNGVVFPMFGLLISSILAVFYDTNHSRLRREANFWAAMFVILACACFVVVPTQMFSFAYAGQNLIRRIRYLTFKGVVRQEISWFDLQENSCGAVSARLSTDAANVRGMVGDTLALTVQNLATVVAGLIIAFTATWQLALVILALVPLLSLQGIMQVKVMTGFSADAKVMYEAASQVASDAIGSIKSVASFCAEDKMLKLYEEKCKVPLKNGIRLGIVSGVGVAVSNFALFSSYSLSFWYGSQLIRDKKSTFKKVFRVFFAVTMSAMGVAHATGLAPDLTKVRTSVMSIFRIIDRKSKIDPTATGGITLDALQGDVQFRHVSFRYPSRPDVQIFRDFSLFVEAGKTAALVGESGSGKSTAIALIQRFYDCDFGKLYIDGKDIKTLQLKWLRQQMSLVGQEPVLFSGTIASNIAYGCGAAASLSQEQIEAAAVAANAHKFIQRLPQGYQTQVGERGSRLSGGQKQRIAIARAMVKKPKILLLDEATSALDAQSERLVQSALNALMHERTVLVVAHRLSTVSTADIIAVVKNGVVAEQGSHGELLAIPGGVYSMLANLQAR